MMDFVFQAHSGLRYVVQLAAIIAVIAFLIGKATGQFWKRPAPLLMSVVVGLVDLQVLLGLILFVGGRRPPGIVGHLALMLAAAAILHGSSSVQRRRPAAGYGFPLAGVTGALALIVMGILAIGRSVV